MHIEDTLTRTLAAATEVAPEPDDGFLAAVTARRRQRQRIHTAAVAGVAAVAGLAVAAVPFAVPDPPDRMPALTEISPGPPVDVSTARPAEQVWPQAVVRLPARLPDGSTYGVLAKLDGDRFLVLPMGTGPVPHLDWRAKVLSAGTGQVSDLVPAGTTTYFNSLRRGERHFLWTMGGTQDGREFREIWSMPSAGGKATRLAVVNGGVSGGGLAVTPFEAGDTTYVTVTAKDGAVPITYRIGKDGATTPVAGTEGYEPTVGPWIGKDSPGAGAPMTFWNLATGARRTPVQPAGYPGATCSPDWCVHGTDAMRPIEQLTAWRFDGRRAVSVRVGPRAVADYGTISGRFATVRHLPTNDRSAAPKMYLWDLQTNTVAVRTYGNANLWKYSGIFEGVTPLSDGPTGKVVLDLTRIK